MKLALCMIVAPTDEESVVLKRCLSNIAPYVDGIFLTITGENEKCEKVAKAFGAHVSHYEWDNHFANARNFALSQVPEDYDYWMWLDCDDVVRGADKLRESIEKNPTVDAFILNYLYWFDEWGNPTVVHLKTRVLRNDGCVEWRGALHEDFHNTRAIDAKMVEGIEVIHMSDERRAENAKKRNVVVAQQDLDLHPQDPRTFWNLGNALKADGDNDGALEALMKFLDTSKSDEEKYIIRLRISEIYKDIGELNKALEQTQMAIGMRPMYPDAYMAAAYIFRSLNRLEEARDHVKMSLQLEPPYHKIIVYNPRAYDLEPLKLLAQIYMELSMPQLALTCLEACYKIIPKDESLKNLIEAVRSESERSQKVLDWVEEHKDLQDEELLAAIEEIEPEMRSHPAICQLRNTRAIKKESSGKDLVFFCGYTERVWTPDALAEGIGGSEEAIIHLSRRLKERGWNVTVYNNSGHTTKDFDGVIYKPYWEWNYRDKQDVVVLWRHPKMLDYEINADKVFVDLHDVIPAGEWNEKRLQKLDGVFLKSQAHRILFPSIPDEKCIIVQNGIEWDTLQKDIERNPKLLINTSSPDRGLKTLLNAFARVRKEVPDAELYWAYGWGVWDTVHSDDPDKMAWKDKIEKQMENMEGVTNLGRIGQQEVAELYQKAGIFAYPTAFYEIDCISARKAQAAGAFPVVTDFAALDETVQYGVKIKTDEENENWGKPYQFDFSLKEKAAVDAWVASVIKYLQNPPTEEERKEMREWTKQFDWESIADKWENVIK